MALVFHTCDGITDLSRYKHTITNVDGAVGKGFIGNGSSAYLNIDSVVSTVASDTVGTWMAWGRSVDATPAAFGVFLSFGDTSATEFICMYIQTSGELISSCFIGGAKQWQLESDDVVFIDNTLIHIAVVQNGTEPVIYVNGVAVAQTFETSTNKTRWFANCTNIDNGRIGSLNYGGFGETGLLGGKEDDIRIYNNIFTADQIKDYYIRSRGRY